MKFKETDIKRLIGHSVKVGLLIFIFALLAFGALLTHTATEKRQAVGESSLTLCQSDGHGGWKVIDRVQAHLNFEISLTDAASSKVLDLHPNWNGTSERGCQGSVGWERATDLHWDVKSGKLDLITPYVLKLNGHEIRIPISCSTESITTPIGTFKGRRAELSGRTLSAAIVGFANFKAPRNLFQCSGGDKKGDEEGEGNFVVVFRGEGKATIVE
jgi:hypothetical protein